MEAAAATQPPSRASLLLRWRWDWWLAGGLLAWALAPVLYLLYRAGANGQTLTGAVGTFAGDQLQYLSWVRSAGEHVLAANGFDLAPARHDYLQPVFLLSGGLWRLGVGVGLAYLAWLPVAVGTLFLGVRAYCRRMLGGGAAGLCALALALFFVTPVQPIAGWLGARWSGLGTASGELAATGALYGYFPAAIAAGLVPLVLLGCERLVEAAREGRRAPSSLLLGTSLAGAVAAWLHPWQGETLLLIIVALAALGRFSRPYRRLTVVAVVTATPLLYYIALSRLDSSWRLGETQSSAAQPGLGVVLLALAPLLAPAAAGFRSWADGVARRILLLWPLASVAVFLISPGYAAHALRGMALPLSVAAVAGWHCLRLPRRTWIAAAAIALYTIPGLVYAGSLFRDVASADPQAMLLSSDERSALGAIERSAPGGVLASARLATAVPAFTGHRTWYGHPGWTPDYPSRYALAARLLGGRLGPARTRALARAVGASYWLSDCQPRDLRPLLGPLLRSERRFGCVVVYQLALPGRNGEL